MEVKRRPSNWFWQKLFPPRNSKKKLRYLAGLTAQDSLILIYYDCTSQVAASLKMSVSYTS